MKPTAVDVAAVIQAALCDRCREDVAERMRYVGESVYLGGLCSACDALRSETINRLRSAVDPDVLVSLASRVLAARSGNGAKKRRGGKTKAEVSQYMRELAALRKHPGRKPKE